MPDDKTKVVEAVPLAEVRQVAEKNGLTIDQVKKLIARVGNDREKIEAAARQLHEGELPSSH